jgi:hypothetical protein
MKKLSTSEIKWSDAKTLEDFVHKLIDEGKRSKDPEFQTLFKLFGIEKITGYAKKYLKEKR